MKSFLAKRQPLSNVKEGSPHLRHRHRHRISVKSKGADLVARKLATKFGEKAEAGSSAVVRCTSDGVGGGDGGSGGGGGVGGAQRESIPGESRSTLRLALSLSLSLPCAILSSRICDHQHAKWIKFLDYTFRRPFFTRFRFLYLASRHHHRHYCRLWSLSPPASLFVRLVSVRSYSRLFLATSNLPRLPRLPCFTPVPASSHIFRSTSPRFDDLSSVREFTGTATSFYNSGVSIRAATPIPNVYGEIERNFEHETAEYEIPYAPKRSRWNMDTSVAGFNLGI